MCCHLCDYLIYDVSETGAANPIMELIILETTLFRISHSHKLYTNHLTATLCAWPAHLCTQNVENKGSIFGDACLLTHLCLV